MSRRFPVEFLTRDACTLCEEARPIVERWGSRLGARVRERDVDEDPALAARYGARVPVVLGPARRVLAEGRITAPAVVLGLIRARLFSSK